MKSIDKVAACTLAVVLIGLAGCGTAPTPSSPLAPSPTRVFTGSPAAVATPSASPSSQPSASVPPLAEDLAVDAHRIDADYTRNLFAVRSLGSEIIWSAGPRFADEAGDLLRYVPGQSEPEELFANPRRGSYLSNIAGSGAGYVFTEEISQDGQPHGWRLTYLAAPGAEPVNLDQSDDDALPSPALAMNERYIAWAPVHGSGANQTSELRVALIDRPFQSVTLLSYPALDANIWFPSLLGDELWYGVRANDWDAGTEQPRVEMIDLGHPSAAPVIFGQAERAFMPAPRSDLVVWKGGGEDWLSALNSGTLTIYWRESGRAETLPIPGPGNAANRISYPSVGDRFISWWDDIHPRFYVYDLVERRFRRIAEYDWAGDESVVRPSLSGDLLAYLHSTGDGGNYLEWSLLPH